MNNDLQQELDAYLREQNLPKSITLKTLLNSHKFLREESIRRSKETSSQRETMRRLAESSAIQAALELGWISKETLRNMTISEFANLFCDPE